MALGATDINTTVVMNEIGIRSHRISVLSAATGLNKFSYYAPGLLTVDTNKDIVLVAPTEPFGIKTFSDFRLYNHTAPAPAVQADYLQIWGPDNANFGFDLAFKFEGLNINAFLDPADHITVKIYASEADRASEANAKHSQIFPISFVADTPLTRHSRQSATKPDTTGWQTVSITDFDFMWLSDPDTLAYCEMYMSDLAGNRKINFGERANNYTTITFRKQSQPHIHPGSFLATTPSGYTSVFPEIHTSDVACASTNPINMTWNESTFTFYVKARGIYGSEERILELTSCDVRLNIGGVYQTVYSGALSYLQGTYITGTLTIGGGAWSYGEEGTIEIINEVYGTNYTVC